MRLANFHSTLSRNGPGLLLRDLREADTPEITATVAVLAAADADVLVLQDIDYDAGGAALAALAALLAAEGQDYPHQFALRPNTGRRTGIDLDGDGRAHRARDAHGYGFFNGQGGMAILSRHPIGEVRDFSDLLWRDLPDSQAEGVTPEAALPILRLHTVAAWDVQIVTSEGPVHILMSHATPPVFDGPEDRNGLRNEDELRFWQLYLDGWSPSGAPFTQERFAVMGTFNVDPRDGQGRRGGINGLLTHPRVQDPAPQTPDGRLVTADWEEPTPGDLRVDFILPSAAALVRGGGILWPVDTPLWGISASQAAEASDHRLVWVDLSF